MSCQVVKHRKILSDDKCRFAVQHLKPVYPLKEELSIIVEYSSLNDVPLEERKKEAEKPMFLARYDD